MRLEADALRWHCDPEALGFATTDELTDLDYALGQERAVEALTFGLGMGRDGYNIYALGASGVHKHELVQHHLEADAHNRELPSDFCYVNNFEEPHRPNILKLPAGRGADFKNDLDTFVDDLRDSLRAAFESDEYRTRRQMIEREFREEQEKAVNEIEREARENGITLQRTPAGFGFAPLTEDGEVMSPDSFHQLDADKQQEIQQEIERLQHRLQEALQQMPKWLKQTREKIRQLNADTASQAVGHLVEALKRRYDPLRAVQDHLDRIQADIVDNVDALLARGDQGEMQAAQGEQTEALLRRYRANLIVDNRGREAAPVVYEDEPSYDRLIGRIEHRAEMGALTTDFHLIREGALHRANGGYLVLDARKVLSKPLAWEALKRTLRAGEVRIESLYQALGLISTVSLEPEPVPLSLKVVLIGERLLYYLLSELDPEFNELFKVAADFEERTDRSDGTRDLYARAVATLARRNELAPFSAAGVARVLEHAARLAADQDKLSIEMETIADTLREADFHARRNGNNPVEAADVDAAIRARERRMGRVRERMHEEILRGTVLIDSDGTRGGQINALTVMSLGGVSFGRPTRVTARAGIGRGNVVDIEREVALGGPIHSKGVLILHGYLAARYARERPLSLSASLVFEQSYGGVEGDSASLAELLTLLSTIADVPLRQDLAVTGSVNQHGQVQPIGGVNEKIEGFFEVCKDRGLTGEQGVVIPDANRKHLTLRQEVVDAVRADSFAVHAVKTVDEAIELFTGMPAGTEDADGRFPADTFNGAVQASLDALAEKRRQFGLPSEARRNSTGEA
ncbi:Predicted ATP-dependent protease [Limimonas halophila]|uniref:endopeptidase La n=1 Tax=Limimonas halophila TaxID=1082479 RepID=A0A1G7PCB4_9PROT|nr:ATP-binding protein [Limimonas halophila]SDF83110.1 Predicted ATP-dependent protease [Limimonas halophila]